MEETIKLLLQARQRDAEASAVSRKSQFSQASSGEASSQVGTIVATIGLGDFEEILAEAAQSPQFAFLDVLSTLFLGAPDTNQRGQKQRFAICSTVVALVDNGDLPSGKEAAASIQRIVVELDTLTLQEVAQLVEAIMAGLKSSGGRSEASYDGTCLALIPKLLMRITQGSFVDENKMLVSGSDFKDQILEQFISIDWPESLAVKLVTLLREIPMAAKQILTLTEKTLALLEQLSVQDLPAFIYQSLLFASTKPSKVRQCYCSLHLETILTHP